MANWTTRRWVKFLHDRKGESYAAIDRRLGLAGKGSFARQVAMGQKKGRGYASALKAQVRERLPAPPPRAARRGVLAGGGRLPLPPRRTTRTGQPARVREGRHGFTVDAREKGKIVGPAASGRKGFTLASGGEKSLVNAMRRAGPGAHVAIRVTFRHIRRYGNRVNLRNYEVDLFPHGGYSVEKALTRIEEAGGLHAWVESYVNDADLFPHIEGASGVVRVEIEIIN